MSNITLNIVEPGSGPTPIEPVVPNTGLFTHGIGGPEATIMAVSTILVLALVATMVWYYKKHTNIHITNVIKRIKNKKSIAIGLTAIAMLVSAGTFASLLISVGKSNTSAAEGENGLTVDVSSEELTIELADEPVFAVLPVDITVEQATKVGYTLTAYADSTDLVSTTDESNTIPMVTVDEGELATLANNTYGLALKEPEGKDSEVYTTLSTDANNPALITDKDYEATEANDTTTIYYGFYVTPDVPYGTYTSGDVYYDVEANRTDLAKVIFDGNGLTFDGGKTTNVMRYDVINTTNTERYSHTPNISDAGVQDGAYPLGVEETSIVSIPGASRLHVVLTYGDGIGYYSDDFVCLWAGADPSKTATSSDCQSGISMEGANNGKYIFNSDYGSPTPKTTTQGDVNDSSSVTFAYVTTKNTGGMGTRTGYGYYAVVTGFDEEGNPVYLKNNLPIAGQYKEPSASFSYKFLGWSTDPNAAFAMYTNADEIRDNLTLSAGGEVKLYAVWKPTFSIAYKGNGADSTTNMDNVVQYTTDLEFESKSVDLVASNFTREGYGFAGWSTDADAWDHLANDSESDDPIIYGPNQTIAINAALIAEAGEDRILELNAVWVPVAKKANGELVVLQDWGGCPNLAATEYDENAGTLKVKKNTITALADSRDGIVYAVAKLADGKCWTIENLRMADTHIGNNQTVSTTVTVANTNNPLIVDGNVAIMNNDGNTSNHLSPTSSNWCNGSDSACIDQSNLNTDNTAKNVASPEFSQDFASSTHQNFDANIVSYGNYYNWYSATVGNGKQQTGSNVTVAGDICPTGWQLPYGGDGNGDEGESKGNTEGGLYYLNQQMGRGASSQDSNNWRSFPNNFVYSGNWSGSSVSSRGDAGNYASNTSGNASDVAALFFSNQNIAPGRSHNNSRGTGFVVRCVAQ